MKISSRAILAHQLSTSAPTRVSFRWLLSTLIITLAFLHSNRSVLRRAGSSGCSTAILTSRCTSLDLAARMRMRLFTFRRAPTHPRSSRWVRSLSEIYSGTEEAYTTSLEIRRLDDVLHDVALDKPALLKLDVQGFELEVLKGSLETLKRIDYVYLEASFIELYKGQPLATEVITWLADHGFNLSGVYHVSFDGTGRAVQADMLFTPNH